MPGRLNSAPSACDCLAHRFGNAADRPDRVRRYPSDMTEGYCHRQMLDAVRYVTDSGIKWQVAAPWPEEQGKLMQELTVGDDTLLDRLAQVEPEMEAVRFMGKNVPHTGTGGPSGVSAPAVRPLRHRQASGSSGHGPGGRPSRSPDTARPQHRPWR